MSQVSNRPGQLCGGTGHVKHANAEVQKICDEVKPEVEKKAGKNFDVFKATAFSSQSVAGTNYFIKVQVGESDYMHIRVFRSLPSEGYKLSLHDIQTPKTLQDPIEFF
ncbi:cystatin-B [Ictalurus furcatus]|uniref:Cystatin-B n=1 Tax=Ictalurus furcatus TaxID=66913 RepID=E3TBV9_ICTFU|nr:cystatin-B [Ictalurus furcatus]ADO27795.1 cystatin-b [Ictalurus furcatus]